MYYPAQPRLQSYQLAWLKQWQPYARLAGMQLHIPWTYVLSQWALESNYGQQSGAGHNNPGNIGSPGHWRNYTSKSSFVSDYVATMKADFPYFSHPLSSGTPTLAEVFGGSQKYAPSVSHYNNLIAGLYAEVANTLGQGAQVNQALSGSSVSGPSGSSGTGPGLGGLLQSLVSPVEQGIWTVVGLLLIVVGVWIWVAGSPKKIVEVSHG